MVCRPYLNYPDENIGGWTCSIYSGTGWVDGVSGVSLELCQKRAEKIAIKYLLGAGKVVSKELKRLGLLDEVLSEIGVEL